jgi:RimJ/RimL family protein N-acetyltransferase
LFEQALSLEPQALSLIYLLSVFPIDCGVCQLRPWRQDDLDSLVRHANSRAVWLGVRDRFPHPYTREVGQAWLNRMTTEEPPSALAITLDDQPVGGIGAMLGSDVNRHTAEVGYWLGERYWGRGLATAAVTGFLPWAARAFGLSRFIGHVFSSNPASMRVLEKSGFAREGILRKHCIKDGRYLDEHLFGRLMDPLDN